ncbi:MAG: response regulator [Candidatus Omnitrophota bacterium]
MSAKRILVVDDDLEFLQELKETLHLSGYEVDAVNKSVNAVGFAIDRKPDLILLDLRMDGMTGFEVAKELRMLPQTSRIPIIAMSGYFSEAQDCTLFDFFQIRDCLQKPFNPLDVISHIEDKFKNADASL